MTFTFHFKPMRQTLAILITVLTLSSFGQSEKKLDDKAFDFYLDKKYDSALIYYQKIAKKKNRASDPYYLNQIWDCFFYLGRNEEAKENYLQSLKDTTEPGRPFAPQRGSCHNLADVYIRECKYDSALYFLRLAEEKWPHFRICSAGEFERLSALNHKFAICFDGMGQPDTSIKYLTQYAFSTIDRFRSGDDSVKYAALVNFYLGVLDKRYSANEIRGEFATAIKNFNYKKELDPEFKKKYPEENYYNVESYIIFFGNKVILREGTYEANSWGGEPVEEYSKQYIFKRFSESILFRLLKRY